MNCLPNKQWVLLALILFMACAATSQKISCGAESDRTSEQPEFLKSFFKHLNASGYTQKYADDFLSIQIRGSSDKFVSIQFTPKTPEQKAAWRSTIDLIARTFVSLLDKAAKEKYYPKFRYNVPLLHYDPLAGYGPQLSISALKVAAG